MAEMGILEKCALAEREHIIKLLEVDKVEREPVCSNSDCEKCPAFERGFNRAIALIKGENKKGHNGGEHTPCCNDWGCYGCEDCDCPDCLEGENK